MPAMPADQIGPLMQQVVPLVATLGLDYLEVTPERAVVLVRDQPAFRNHVGGPHAAVVFAVAESATGAVAIANLGDLLDRAVLLPTTVTMEYLSISLGDLTATATIVDDVAAVREQFEAGTRPEFDIVADIANADGQVTARLRARWTVKLLRKSAG
jgi:acyl-coenzyme A thioesterase PaaI-like protein